MDAKTMPDGKPTLEYLDRVYPADVFGETFDRKQVAWIMAVYMAEHDDTHYCSEKRS